MTCHWLESAVLWWVKVGPTVVAFGLWVSETA
jgi:hypothetical protein